MPRASSNLPATGKPEQGKVAQTSALPPAAASVQTAGATPGQQNAGVTTTGLMVKCPKCKRTGPVAIECANCGYMINHRALNPAGFDWQPAAVRDELAKLHAAEARAIPTWTVGELIAWLDSPTAGYWRSKRLRRATGLRAHKPRPAASAGVPPIDDPLDGLLADRDREIEKLLGNERKPSPRASRT